MDKMTRRTRRMARWARALAVATALATFGVVGQAPPAGAACPTYFVIGVRGSLEPFSGPWNMGPTVGTYAQYVAEHFPRADSDYMSLSYPAVQPGPVYLESVALGSAALRWTIRDKIYQCRGLTRIGLIGYSQGAHVVNDALQGLTVTELSYIRGVLQIADPRRDPTTASQWQVDTAGNLAPRPAYGGAFGPRALPSAVRSRAANICFVFDVVCNAPTSGFDALVLAWLTQGDIHERYALCCSGFNVRAVAGAHFADAMMAPWTPPSIPPDSPPPPPPSPPSVPLPPPSSIEVKGNDYTRDGVSDLLTVRSADGCLARYRGTGTGSVTYDGDIGCGWGGYRELTAVGDITGDGVGDLVAIRNSDGCLARYKGTNTGSVHYYGDAGCGWGGYRNLAGMGDLNGDGVGDLLAVRESDGCLARYRGTGAGSVTSYGDNGCGWGSYAKLT